MLAPISDLTITGNTDTTANTKVTFSAHIINPLKQPQPAGTVTWTSNEVTIGQSQVSAAGSTSITTAFPTPGSYSLVASYEGEQEPGSIVFTENVLSKGPNGSAPFTMNGPASVSMSLDGSSQASIAFTSAGVAKPVAFTSAGVAEPVALTCSGAPVGYTCNLSATGIAMTSGTTAPTVTATVSPTANVMQARNMAAVDNIVAGVGLGVFGVLGLEPVMHFC